MPSETLFTAPDLQAKVERLALEIFENCQRDKPLALVGIHSRGEPLAERVAELLRGRGMEILTGSVDISLYRDDLDEIGKAPKLVGSKIDFDLNGAQIILFDDVLFTGRTVRAAIDALTDYGRPAAIELAVLIDRGNRELPIQADYLGVHIETDKQDDVQVLVKEIDGRDEVIVISREAQ